MQANYLPKGVRTFLRKAKEEPCSPANTSSSSTTLAFIAWKLGERVHLVVEQKVPVVLG